MKINLEPISNVQWVQISHLVPNLYNPNTVAPPEMQLLKTSIMEDGWLFPITVFDASIHIEGLTDNEQLDRYTIIDGFHRYTLALEDEEVFAKTGGVVPCIILNPTNPIATTVRLNRAKGTHSVTPMAKLMQMQIDQGKSVNEIMTEFGMEYDEVQRLLLKNGIPASEYFKGKDFSPSWIPS